MRVAMFVVVAFCTLTIGFYEMNTKPEWTFDGYVYSVRAQTYAGIPYTDALRTARDAYRSKPAVRTPHARTAFGAQTPLWWKLFAVRAVYPALAAALWHFAGFQSLFYVSLSAYVISALLLYGMLLRFAVPVVAAVVALTCMLEPQAQLLARSNLTDMLAFAFLAAALLAAMRYADRGSWSDLAAFIVAGLLLSFTRPVPYDLACATAPLVLTAAWRRGLELLVISLALCAAVASAMHLTGGAPPPIAGYTRAVLVTSWTAAVLLVKSAIAPIAIIALYAARRRLDVHVCAGALASIVLTILANPNPGDVPRVVVLPSLIPLACGCAIAAQAALYAGRAHSTGAAIVRQWSGSESILAAQRPKSSPLA